MGTEGPEELEGAEGLKAMVSDFVEKMDFLTKIKELLQQLNTAGHFEYISGAKYRFSAKQLDATELQCAIEDLEKRLMAWNQAVDRVRSEYYFLNYYTVCEMQFLSTRIHKFVSLQQ